MGGDGKELCSPTLSPSWLQAQPLALGKLLKKKKNHTLLWTMAAISSSVSFPFFVDLRRPELLLNNTISLYLATEPGVTVGIW